jgi:pimeloyl-ACP methyl ester carboxylesterase
MEPDEMRVSQRAPDSLTGWFPGMVTNMTDDPIAPISCRFFANGLSIHYLDWGNAEAPLLVLLHGGLEHAHGWDHIAAELRRGWHVIVPDLRGHGDSDWSTGSAYSTLDHTVDLTALIEHLHAPRATLVGHSLGGNIALRFAALFPERAERVCAIEGLGLSPAAEVRRDGVPRLKRYREWVERQLILARRERRLYASVEAAAARLLEHDPQLETGMADHLVRHGVRPSGSGVVWKYDEMVRGFGAGDFDESEPAALWAAIACPTLLVYGAMSWASNPASDGRAAHFRTAEVVVIEQAGHNLQHHRPGEFLEVLQRFLGLPSRGELATEERQDG